MKKVLKQFEPDVIISFDAESSAVFFGTCPNMRIPLITMFHFSVDEAVNWEDAQEIEALKNSDCVQVLLTQTSHTENIPYALINQLELNVESHSRTLLCTQTTHPKSGQIVQESFQERFDQQDF